MSSPTHAAAPAPQGSTSAQPSLLADLRSGFLVFLIALPLCLGIALASGFPPIAGIMTAIVGGLLATPLGSARLTIKGPAAGLIVIVIGAVTELGAGDPALGYHRTLAVGCVAAVIQIAFAFLRTATVGIAMSPSVVHGMLAAIGVIIISKQSHQLLGVKAHGSEPFELLAELPSSIASLNPEVALIGIVSLAILFCWPFLRSGWAKKIPAPLVVLFVAVPMGQIFDMAHAHTYEFWNRTYELGPRYLVQLPASLLDAVQFPDFSAIFSPTSIKYIVMFSLVGTIESTLSCLAVDAMDPAKRATNLNKDLLSLGVGNLVASAIGGLPMISEIVRSKANIDAGAQSSKSNLFHGAFLLLFVVAAPWLLQMIPLAALAAMLVLVGFRLASPGHFKHALHIGRDQLLLFATTMIVTLATDLLIGVGVGIALKVGLHLSRGASLRTLFRPELEQATVGDELRIQIRGAAAFPSLLPLRKIFGSIENGVRVVVVDLSESVLVDHTFLERLKGMADEFRDVTLKIVGTDGLSGRSEHPHATRRRSR